MTLTKLEVAVSQLSQAIRLFLEEDYLSSLTLSGAAEEILGKLCERSWKPVTIEEIIAFHSARSAKSCEEFCQTCQRPERNAFYRRAYVSTPDDHARDAYGS